MSTADQNFDANVALHGPPVRGGQVHGHGPAIVVSSENYKQSVVRYLLRFGYSVVDAAGGELPAAPNNEKRVISVVEHCPPKFPKCDYSAELTAVCRRSCVILIGRICTDSHLGHLLQIGARGYVCLPEQLLALDKAIQHVAASRLWFSRSVLEMTILNLHARIARSEVGPLLASGSIRDVLTSRESIVATLVGEGMRNRDIGKKLNITEKTVKLHLSNIFRKTGISSRLQLALSVIRSGDAES